MATIDYIADHGLVANAANVGGYLMDQMLALKETYPLIGNVAGVTDRRNGATDVRRNGATNR